MLFLPPLIASVSAYFLTKGLRAFEQKVLSFWLTWSAIAITIHLLLGLEPLIALAYPLLALSTAYAMIKRVRELSSSKRLNRRDKG
ncbi:hypothetical protein EYM_01015 [Ignicoccus islandicus DSM 13165]|uniref:Uncharacterized protein n=2 Tax=Ignicoccus islandicus TaxID=54259 RepID=A0A0U3F817_9CREN|nr:hypothetical protein EYM_01015 [Ignicoccus islandicus DSM 13165]